MPTLRVELPARLSQADVEALRGDLAPYGYVDELESASYDPAAVMLGISFVSDLLQGAEVLANWLKRTPRGNRAVIRLADGRTLSMETSGDPDAFLKALKGALKQM